MRWRKWISLIAVLDVLLHAGALVHHNGAVLASAFYDTLAADLLVICHGSADAKSGDLATHSPTPGPSDAKSSCPICSGQVSAFALAAPELPGAVAPAATSFARSAAPRVLLVQRSAVCPPARGPPTLV